MDTWIKEWMNDGTNERTNKWMLRFGHECKVHFKYNLYYYHNWIEGCMDGWAKVIISGTCSILYATPFIFHGIIKHTPCQTPASQIDNHFRVLPVLQGSLFRARLSATICFAVVIISACDCIPLFENAAVCLNAADCGLISIFFLK